MSLRGRTLFGGFLAHDNAARIAELMSNVLVGNRYVFVAVNEALSFPSVRVNCELAAGEVTMTHFGDDDEYVGIRFDDNNYTAMISTSAKTPIDAHNHRVDSPNRVYVTVTDEGVEIDHHAGIKMAHGRYNRIVWTLAVTGPLAVLGVTS